MKRFLAIAFLVLTPFLSVGIAPVLADEPPPPPVNIGNPIDPKYGDTQTPQPTNPQEDTIKTVQGQLGTLLTILLRGIAALSLLPIVVGGFQMIISQGDDGKVSRGKETLYFGIVGLILALIAIAFFQTFLSFILPS